MRPNYWAATSIAAAMLTTSPAYAFTFRGLGSLQSCMLTIGNFCPIESIGVSLLGTVAIAVVLFVLGLARQAMTGQTLPRQSAYASPSTPSRSVDTLRFARVQNLLAIGDFDAAGKAIEHFIKAGDPGAQPYLEKIQRRLQDWNNRAEIAVDLMKAGENEAAFRYLKKLAEEDDTLSMFNVGVLYIKGRGTPAMPIEGMKWMSLAARRGEANAIEMVKRDAGMIAHGRESEVETFVSGWKPVTAS